MSYSLETWSWIAAIVAVPVAVIGWFLSGKQKVNKSTANRGAIAISGDVRAERAGIIAGHNSPVSLKLSVGDNGREAETYAKRYAVWQSTRAFLDELASDVLVSDETLRTIRRNSDDAGFLFDAELAAYVEEIFRRASLVQSITIAMQGLPVGDDKARASRKAGEHRQWLLEQDQQPNSILNTKFRPVLQRG